MLTAQAHIHTQAPGRYLTQFCRHANSMQKMNGHMHRRADLHRGELQDRAQVQHVEWTDTDGSLTLSLGRCTLHASADTLTVRAEAANEQNLRQIQELVTRDLERFGRRNHLTVTWQQPETSGPIGEAS
jgi:hypothetical protein